MSRAFALPAGRRAKWLVVVAWLLALVAIVGGDLAGKFADAEENESASFLPGDAESTRALQVTERLQGGELAPTIVVYRREGGLTPQDRAAIARDIGRLNEATRRFENATPFGAPQLSRDGTTALVGNQIRGTGEGEDIIDPVEAYRELVSDPGGGLQVKVAGPAGISADAIKVFEGINGTLLAAAFGLVVVLLILIYRSPVFWILPIAAVGVAELATRGLGWVLTELGVTVNGQSSAILSILVIGAGTDYALLLVSRYREELRRHEDKHEAMALALRSAGPAIFASGLTVCAALLSLSLAKVNGTAGLGPIGAMGIAVAMLVMLTLLPALLVIVGRRPFWPFIPRVGAAGADATHGRWRAMG
ncbi:MAG: MMPL family transporter, partial [Actinomycetota bacterium]|nr:MMPL family transporter [Actinomycetota bacterium]